MNHSNLVTEDIKMALETVRTHKVRSFLTVLGVVIGVMVAILVASILLGVEDNVQASLDEFGVDNLFIFKFDPGFHAGNFTAEERVRKSLTYEDGMAIKEGVSNVKDVAIQVLPHIGQTRPPVRPARYKNHELNAIIFRGTTASYAEVQNVRMKEGRFYTETEDLHRVEAVVIGYDVANTLFPNESPIGKQLLVDGSSYLVMGVLEKKKNITVSGVDSEVLIPYHTYTKHYPGDDEILLRVMAYPGKKDAAADQIRAMLRMRRRVPFDKPDNFGISSAEQLGNQFREIMSSIFQLVIGVVSIGLLVGGVGVMNIMLMSVTERTREIGVRKAIGARKRDISFQFITEAMTLTGMGGIIGVILSLIISFILHLIHFPSSVPVWAIMLAVAVSCSVGLFFGIYPAMKAARLDPVMALRYE